MSRKYKKPDEVPTETLAERAAELVRAITARDSGRSLHREFDMRIPVELDRDADCVITELYMRLQKTEAELAALKAEPVQPPQFPTMLRKMWSGGEVQDWINENWHGSEPPQPQGQDNMDDLAEQYRLGYEAGQAQWQYGGEPESVPSVASGGTAQPEPVGDDFQCPTCKEPFSREHLLYVLGLPAQPVGFKKAEPPSKFDMDWSFYAEDDFRIPETLEEFKAACYHFHKAGQQSQPEPVESVQIPRKEVLELHKKLKCNSVESYYVAAWLEHYLAGAEAGQQSGEGREDE